MSNSYLDCRGACDRGARARDNHARDRRQTGLVAAARRERCAVLARGVDVDHRDAAPRRCWTAIRPQKVMQKEFSMHQNRGI